MSPPILQYPNFSDENEFILQTDASGIAIGAVLCNKDMKPVAYTSRPLNKAELNYPTIQKELLAIVWSVKYFRPYLFGRKFTIMTDHKPLMYLFGMKDPSNRLLKFRLQLEEYDFAIIYIPGRDNVVADALSRVVITSSELKDINQKLTSAMIMTRAQTKKKEEEEGRMRNNASTESTKFTNMTTDLRPKVVEILRKPSDSVELKFIKGHELDKLRKINRVTTEEKCLAFVEDQLIIYINLNYMSHFTRDEFADILRVFL